MRIAKEFNIGHLKCTLLLINGRYNLKIEDQYGEIHYKLGTMDSDLVDDIESYLQLPKIRLSIAEAFVAMRKGRDHLVHVKSSLDEETFDEII